MHAPYDLANLVVFVRTDDLDPATGALKPGAPKEPLILRVAAGDWVQIVLTNALGNDPNTPRLPRQLNWSAGTPFTQSNALPNFDVSVSTSLQVGLHPALVAYDVTAANGVNVGFNPDSTVKPVATPATQLFYWYAGELNLRDR